MKHHSPKKRFMEPNTTQTPNYVFDSLLKEPLSLAELKITLAVIRHTYGWGETNWEMSISDLCQITGLARPNVQRAASRLVVGSDRLPPILGRKVNKAGVFVYWLLIDKKLLKSAVENAGGGHATITGGAMQHVQQVAMLHGPPKEERKTCKSKFVKSSLSSSSKVPTRVPESQPDDDDNKSRFDLDTIRKYAEHLDSTKARSVRNTEGLALKMRQTGDDDERIAKWLKGSETPAVESDNDPYAVFRRIVGLSMDLAKRMKKKGVWNSGDDQNASDRLFEGGAITSMVHYWLLREFALARLKNDHLGLSDELIEAKRKEFRKAG